MFGNNSLIFSYVLLFINPDCKRIYLFQAAGTYLTPNPYPSKIPIFPYIEPNLQYKQPSPTYSQPRLTKNQPKLTYKKPRPTFNQARPTYSQPSPIYNKPSPTYNQPRPIYNQPSSHPKATHSQTNRIGSYESTSNSISQVNFIYFYNMPIIQYLLNILNI